MTRDRASEIYRTPQESAIRLSSSANRNRLRAFAYFFTLLAALLMDTNPAQAGGFYLSETGTPGSLGTAVLITYFKPRK